MPRFAVPALLVSVLALGTACNGSDDPGATPSEPTSTATEAPSTEPTATESETASVAPATGPELEMPRASVRVPEGWEIQDQLVSAQTEAFDDDTASLITVSETEDFSGGQLTLEQMVDIWFQTSPYDMRPKALPATELDGVEVYHLAGKTDRLSYLEEFGADRGDRIVALTFELSTELSPQEREEIVDSVVATFRWK